MAEQFMNQYYVKMNLQEAKASATDAAVQKMEENFAKLAGSIPEEKRGSHKATYALGEKSVEGKHSFFIYALTIGTQDADSVKRQVYLSVDLIEGAWRITDFNENAPPL